MLRLTDDDDAPISMTMTTTMRMRKTTTIMTMLTITRPMTTATTITRDISLLWKDLRPREARRKNLAYIYIYIEIARFSSVGTPV